MIDKKTPTTLLLLPRGKKYRAISIFETDPTTPRTRDGAGDTLETAYGWRSNNQNKAKRYIIPTTYHETTTDTKWF